MATVWGILSAGKISHDFVTCLRSIEGHEVKVVAAKNVENAKKFAELHSIPVVLDNYEDMVNQGVGECRTRSPRVSQSISSQKFWRHSGQTHFRRCLLRLVEHSALHPGQTPSREQDPGTMREAPHHALQTHRGTCQDRARQESLPHGGKFITECGSKRVPAKLSLQMFPIGHLSKGSRLPNSS